MVVEVSTYNHELTFKGLNGNVIFVHINCTRTLLTTFNTLGWVRNAVLSTSITCHIMLEFA